MVDKPDNTLSTFVRALIVGAIGLTTTMLGTYFIWLGTEVNAIGKKVERIDVNVNNLIAARERAIDARGESNAARVGALERGRQ